MAGKARRLGLSTDSSYRFERGVDFGNTLQALERATGLIIEICGGKAGGCNASCVGISYTSRCFFTTRTSRVCAWD